MQIGSGFWASKTLLSAVELGVFTELARRPAMAEDLRERLQLYKRAELVMAILVALFVLLTVLYIWSHSGG